MSKFSSFIGGLSLFKKSFRDSTKAESSIYSEAIWDRGGGFGSDVAKKDRMRFIGNPGCGWSHLPY